VSPGKTPYSRMKTWAAEGRASGPVWLLYIHQDSFKEMLSAIPSMIERIVFLLVDRNREFTKAEEQIAKPAALGKLAANIAHELNNPASAARSSVTAYFSQLSRSENLKYQIGRLLQSDEKQLVYSAWIGQFRATAEAYFYTVNALNPALPDYDEEALLEWLESERVEEAWSIAPTFAEAGVRIATLEQLKGMVGSELVLEDTFYAPDRSILQDVFLARIDPVRARPTNACERRRSDLAADEATANTPS
jgi:signal transduction histidine kinase